MAVWGPSGSPGRSTVATNLAAEAALAGHGTVLVDADTYGPSLRQWLGNRLSADAVSHAEVPAE